jgi:hypothetical protein
MMRGITRLLPVLLVLLPLLARADGFAYGKDGVFQRLTETDQIAVVHCEPGRVTLDMYIAIDGIPPGETITYVLPFWQKAEGFTLAEEDSESFSRRHTWPVARRVKDMNDLDWRASGELIQTLSLGGAVVGGPVAALLAPAGALARSKGRYAPMEALGVGPLTPDATYEVATARAELYSGVKPGDLQTLVAQAGLPASYAEPLKRYRTEHFAVMTLRGMAAPPPVEGTPVSTRGVHYHFTHAAEGTSYTYTYPLGTGAAWPKPIVLTEVYVDAPDELVVQPTAPLTGKALRMWNLRQAVRVQRTMPDIARTGPEATEAGTGSLLREGLHASSAWHVAYLNSNPGEDISIVVRPRGNMARFRFARALQQPATPPLVAALAVLLALLPSWFVVRTGWRRAGQPGHLWLWWLKAIAWTVGTMALTTYAALALFAGLETFGMDSLEHPVLVVTAAAAWLALGVCGLLAARRRLPRLVFVALLAVLLCAAAALCWVMLLEAGVRHAPNAAGPFVAVTLILALLAAGLLWLKRKRSAARPATNRAAIGLLISVTATALAFIVSEDLRHSVCPALLVVLAFGLPQAAALRILYTRTGPLPRLTYIGAWTATLLTYLALSLGALGLAGWAGGAVRG